MFVRVRFWRKKRGDLPSEDVVSENPYADLFHALSDSYLAAEKKRREDPDAVPGGGRKVSDGPMGVKCSVCGTFRVNTQATCSGMTNREAHEPTRCELVPVVERPDVPA